MEDIKMIRAGLIGLGRIGFQWEQDTLRLKPATHLGCMEKLKASITLQAVCDVDKDRCAKAQTFYYDGWKSMIASYLDYKEMLESHNFDLIAIATPADTHHEIAVECAKHKPKIIILEKPMATTIEQAHSILSACRDNGVKLAVNHTRRWERNWCWVKQELNEGVIGKFLMVCKFSGDMLETGTHMADLVNWYRPAEHRCYQMQLPYLLFEVDLLGEEGRITVSDNGRGVSFYRRVRSMYYEGIEELAPQVNPYFRVTTSLLLTAYRDLLSCMDTGREPKCTGEDGFKALELALEWRKEYE